MNSSFSLCACGPNCWEAREEVCRCSCGGRYHGVRRQGPVCEPVNLRRQMVWNDYLWELSKVSEPVLISEGCYKSSDLDGEARALNKAAGIVYYDSPRRREFYDGTFPVAHVRPVTAAQLAKWPELRAWRMPHVRPESFVFYGKPCALWLRLDELTARVKLEMAKATATPELIPA